MKRLILALLTGAAFAASSPAYAAVKTIVLVHGAFADGSGWNAVADILLSHGYSVLVVQEPETSFAADVAATRRVLDKAGPCVLVGHSYGGMIITEAGIHPDVKSSCLCSGHAAGCRREFVRSSGKVAAGWQKHRPGWRWLSGSQPRCVSGRFRCRRSQAGRAFYGDIPSTGFR